MELAKNTKPLQVAFTAPEAVRIVSDNGAKCMIFEAGQTRNVHRDLFGPAIAAGLVPEGPMEVKPEPEPKKQSREELVEEGLLEACKELIARGNPKDFTVVGQPRAASVKKLVDFRFTSREVQRAFEQAMHEVEHGDNDTKRTEPSSSTS